MYERTLYRRRFHGKVMPYSKLPQEAQLSMAHYMAIDGEAWSPSVAFFDATSNRACAGKAWLRAFTADLPHYVREYGKTRFGLVKIPTAALCEAIWLDSQVREDFADFQAYHKWYLSLNDTPNHGASRWPVILAHHQPEEETLQDGWHRLHFYIKSNVRIIPALYYV